MKINLKSICESFLNIKNSDFNFQLYNYWCLNNEISFVFTNIITEIFSILICNNIK